MQYDFKMLVININQSKYYNLLIFYNNLINTKFNNVRMSNIYFIHFPKSFTYDEDNTVFSIYKNVLIIQKPLLRIVI